MHVPSHMRRFAAISALGVALLLARPDVATSVGEQLPDLQPLNASELRLETTTSGTLLRFTATSVNRGDGPLVLFVKAGEAPTNGRQNVYQRIDLTGGGSTEQLAGAFVYHGDHSHFHFEQYANYTLIPVDGGPGRTGEKTTFCVMDTDRIDTKLPGAPRQAVYRTCGADVQGMSVGWGDSYRYYLAGQSVEVTDAPAGRYRLVIDIDPSNRLTEKSDSNNQSSVLIDLDVAAGRVSVVGAKPRR